MPNVEIIFFEISVSFGTLFKDIFKMVYVYLYQIKTTFKYQGKY